jgi:acetate---CoA ligase (ADP-forming)
LFNPRGIAVVGASADLTRIGGQPIRALTEFGYRGKVYPVNPKHTEIKGLRCYPDVTSVPQPCDVALVAVAAELVPRIIEQCGEAGISFAVILSAGFSEIGEKGEDLQAQLDVAIEKSGVGVVGPNCQGILNLQDRVYNGFGSIFQYPDLKSGPVAMVTQSGGFGYAVVGLAEYAGVGFNYVVSTGNEADIDTLDLLTYFLEQDEVEIVATYMEGVTDGRRLLDIGARALDVGKPILVWKVGNSTIGRRAAASHTANLTASYELYRAAFREGGFVEVNDVYDLVDVSQAFQMRKLPEGENAAVISISGGAGVLLADRCEDNGLKLPSLSEETIKELREFVPAFGTFANPIDVTAQIFNDPAMFNRAVSVVLTDPTVHQVIISNASIPGATAKRLANELADIAQRTAKPISVAWSATPGRAVEAMQILEQNKIPCCPTPGRVATAAAALNDFAIKRRRRSTSKSPTRLVEHRALDLRPDGKALGEHRSKACIAAYGVPVVREVLLTPEDVYVLNESPIPFPAVVKVESPDIVHKSEAGVVRLGVQNLDALKKVTKEVVCSAREFGNKTHIEGILIQEMVDGLEVIVGTVNDPFFGPTVAFGLGGIFTEILRDVTHRFAPFDVDTAREMIMEIRGSALLRGARGRPPLDTEALVEVLSRISLLAADHADRIAEIDINPLFVRQAGRGVVAADALVVLRDSNDA